MTPDSSPTYPEREVLVVQGRRAGHAHTHAVLHRRGHGVPEVPAALDHRTPSALHRAADPLCAQAHVVAEGLVAILGILAAEPLERVLQVQFELGVLQPPRWGCRYAEGYRPHKIIQTEAVIGVWCLVTY